MLSAPVVLPLPAPAASAVSGQDAIHEVMPGDDLRLIAGYYYGDTRQWERIWKANRDQIKNPNRIEKGSLLRIPDATVPAEPYTAFVARTQRPAFPAPIPSATQAPPIPLAPAKEATPPTAAPKSPVPAPPAGQPTKAGPPAGPPPLPAKPPAGTPR